MKLTALDREDSVVERMEEEMELWDELDVTDEEELDELLPRLMGMLLTSRSWPSGWLMRKSELYLGLCWASSPRSSLRTMSPEDMSGKRLSSEETEDGRVK
ncbi:hypothetical protein BpHYR1_041432 [Brachionus plicatilis]|uniref:Uncharacterized protein n=1 Tax=Brachionus plicatilis TaxID=10195 RepID=A0A3M7PUX3_BRAPC|nr:hypothetical protein BpHYR1_041432 [Brachionus plicatilis]